MSQPKMFLLALHGPYVIEHAALSNNGDTVELWTPQAGDVLLRLFPDFQALQQWDAGYLSIGQNGLPITSAASGHIGHGINDGSLENIQVSSSYPSGFVFHSNDPVILSIGGIPADYVITLGHLELYALVAHKVG